MCRAILSCIVPIEDVVKPIENNLRRLRRANGLRIEDVAHSIGVDQSTLSKWERGVNECPDEFKIALADYFDWPVWAIFLLDPSENHIAETLDALLDRIHELEREAKAS